MALPDYAILGINDGCLVDSWSEPEPYQDNVTTDFEGGNKRNRSRPGDDLARYQFDIQYTNAEYATFKNFVLTTLGKGTSRFTMRVWDGAQMVTKTVQFASRFKPTPVPPLKMRVTFDLWIYP